MGDLIIRPKTKPICGGCEFACPVAENLTLIECRGIPPTPVLLGADPRGNPVVNLMSPRLPRTSRACALFQEKTPEFSEQN